MAGIVIVSAGVATLVGGPAILLASQGISGFVKRFHPTKKHLEKRLLKLNSIKPSAFRLFGRATQRKKFLESLGYKYPMTRSELIDKIKALEDIINKKVKEQEIQRLQQKIPSRKSTKRKSTKRKSTKRRKTKRRKTKRK